MHHPEAMLIHAPHITASETYKSVGTFGLSQWARPRVGFVGHL
jgi:hypothetical protein